MTSLHWMNDGLCREVGLDMFFPERGENPSEARSVCRACPVSAECLQYALEIGPVHGIWGGTTAIERANMRRHLRVA